MTTFSVDPEALRSMASAVGLCIDTVPSEAPVEAESCGSAAVAAALADFSVWRRVTWNQAEAALNDLCSGATAASIEYAAADSGVASASHSLVAR